MRARTTEEHFAGFVRGLQPGQASPAAARVAKDILRAVTGTAIAGACEDGVEPLRRLLVGKGGTAEASVLVWGDRIPAASAAYVNGVMCRALDYCDAMAPGLHIGSSLVPAALAAAELAGGCTGGEFLAALCAGAELSSRLNLGEAQYDGLDPTGVAGVFAAAAAAARILQLTELQTLHALALAFNRCGGSFQSNVDGTLAVRFIQGWVAETGVHCAQLARAGITGPVHFLDGVYGYFKLYAKGQLSSDQASSQLGERWAMEGMMFKRYPSCGLTQGVTHLALQAVRDGLRPEDVERVEVRLPPYGHRLVGHEFSLGDNPRVNAQFSAQYCVANALHRKGSVLAHFTPSQVQDADVARLIHRIRVIAVPAMDARGHTAVDLQVFQVQGGTRTWSLDIAPGFPGEDLTPQEHRMRFDDCLAYAARRPDAAATNQWLQAIDRLEQVPDVRALVPLLVATP
jgi:2-methylcitrate dehydratase PrpD